MKKVLNLHKNENKTIFDWFEERRALFIKCNYCPHETFLSTMKSYDDKPSISLYSEPKTKDEKDSEVEIMKFASEDKTTVLLYPQTFF